MLTPFCYRLLGLKSVSDTHRRAFLCMVAEYDMRDFIVINPFMLALDNDFLLASDFTEMITHFERAGVLEAGPRVNRKATYRIRPKFLITATAMRQQEEVWKLRRERESMIIWPSPPVHDPFSA